VNDVEENWRDNENNLKFADLDEAAAAKGVLVDRANIVNLCMSSYQIYRVRGVS
jgi:hypothetical protein